MSGLTFLICLFVAVYGAMVGKFSDGIAWAVLVLGATVGVDIAGVIGLALTWPSQGGAGLPAIMVLALWGVFSLAVGIGGPLYAVSKLHGYAKATEAEEREEGYRRVVAEERARAREEGGEA